MVIYLEITRDPNLSHAAKLLYGRLCLFAGKNGMCNPSHETLAREVCLSVRRVLVVLAELRAYGLVTWKRTRSSCVYTVRRSRYAENGVSDMPKTTTLDTPKTAHKKMSLKRGSLIDVKTKHPTTTACLDLKKPVEVQSGRNVAAVAFLDKYRFIRPALRSMVGETDPEQPSVHKVVRIIQACGSPPEREILIALRDLKQRGYGDGHIRTYKYFETALADYLRQKQEREDAATPIGFDAWKDRNDEITRKAAAFDFASR